VELLTRAYTEGRLTKDEHDARVERAMTAATFAELDAVVIDLPGGGPVAVPPAGPGRNWLDQLAGHHVPDLRDRPVHVRAARPDPGGGVRPHGPPPDPRTGEQGAGMAQAGLILGWIGVGFTALVVMPPSCSRWPCRAAAGSAAEALSRLSPG